MKNCFIKLVSLYLFIHFNFTAFTQIDSEKDQQFFEKLYNFQFSDADSIINTIDSIQEPSQYNFLNAHYIRWYYLPIHQQTDQVLSKYNFFLEASDYKVDEEKSNFHYINSALLKAEFNYNQGNYYKSFQNAAKVYDLVKDHLESKPDAVELKFLASLYHYFYQYYKSEKPVFGTLVWFFKEGDKETGLFWLEEVAKSRSVLSTEALVYLSHIYLRLENQPDKAVGFAKQLLQKHPDNLKFYEFLIEGNLAMTSREESILSLIKELESSKKIYFQKYGVCYQAIYQAQNEDFGKSENIINLKNALSFINKNGGGNHLTSLIYNSLYQFTGEEEYLKQKNKHEVYQFALTGYIKSQNN